MHEYPACLPKMNIVYGSLSKFFFWNIIMHYICFLFYWKYYLPFKASKIHFNLFHHQRSFSYCNNKFPNFTCVIHSLIYSIPAKPVMLNAVTLIIAQSDLLGYTTPLTSQGVILSFCSTVQYDLSFFRRCKLVIFRSTT